MSLLSQWGSSRDEAADLILETSDGNLRSKDEEQIKKLLFTALKLAEVDAIKNILHFSRGLLNEQLHGYEGTLRIFIWYLHKQEFDIALD
jgi:hypothetical protein